MREQAGILNVDKPLGLTSHDVVNRIRRVAGTRRVGHGGTLDPLASGVLIVAVGVATRLLEYVTGQAKTYEAAVRLGQTSKTYDAEGELSPAQPEKVLELSAAAIEEALEQLRGPIEQVPPMYSAVKRQGQPLYELARQGVEVAREPRRVTIYELTLVAWQPPDLQLLVRCSAGTYIRSLAHDLGQELETGAYLAGLRRTAVGPFTLDSAIPLEMLNAESFVASLQAADSAVSHLPRLDASAEEAKRLRNGQPVSGGHIEMDAELARVYDPAGHFVGIVAATDGHWQPRKIFNVMNSPYD
ncbi:MAG: tRNA pseudouridine(55) synthase TruB [Anaerolineae bacterium]|nr:tRNA pseudouridine(55) synthase TruB [Anaerolineae bacterium]